MERTGSMCNGYSWVEGPGVQMAHATPTAGASSGVGSCDNVDMRQGAVTASGCLFSVKLETKNQFV